MRQTREANEDVQADRLIVAIEVEGVLPESDPREPSLDSEAVELLWALRDHAVDGDMVWLKLMGKVYQLREAP